jgi:hypothetical protein
MHNNQRQENQDYIFKLIKQGILLFWFCWFLIAFLSNTTDFLIAKNIISNIPFHSGNYFALEKVLSIFNTPTQLLNLLFTLDIITQGISAILFLIANYYFLKGYKYWVPIHTAFGISMLLWAAFIILEEVFIAYIYEGTHIRLLCFELISLLAIHILPHRNKCSCEIY